MCSIINLIFLLNENIHRNTHIFNLGTNMHFFRTYAKIHLDNERGGKKRQKSESKSFSIFNITKNSNLCFSEHRGSQAQLLTK